CNRYYLKTVRVLLSTLVKFNNIKVKETVGHKVEKANARQAHLVFFHRNTHHIKNQKSLPHQLT
uniref:hypothetical protein n=1 Tax=uncultured Tenacibaculum sp. TaxID=174713 RepID=UPI00261A267D